MKTEKEYWDQAKELLQGHTVVYEKNEKFDLVGNPKGLIAYLSRCKFAMRMASQERSILHLGCEIGVGASILGEFATSYMGVDQDLKAVEIAKKNLPFAKYQFVQGNYSAQYGTFDTIICFDSFTENSKGLLPSILKQLLPNGIFITGGESSSVETEEELRLSFHHVWKFGMSGEMVHTHSDASYHLFFVLF